MSKTVMKKALLRSALAAVFALSVSAAQAYPDGQVTVIVPFGAGTSVDTHGRDFANFFGKEIGESVVVDNRPGAEGTIGALATLNAKPDGHTIMFTSSSIPVLDPLMKKNLRFDPAKDFVPLCTVGRTSNVMNISGSSPLKTAKEVIAKAKEQPGAMTFAYSSATTRLAGELFQQAAGIKLLGVPYKTSATGLTDTASGEVDLMFIDDISASGFYQQKHLRPLVVSGSERIGNLPDTPSAAEIGVPGYSIQPWFATYVPSGTPAETVKEMREKMQKALTTPEAVANAKRRGLIHFVICGEELDRFQKEDIELWRGVLEKAGIEPV